MRFSKRQCQRQKNGAIQGDTDVPSTSQSSSNASSTAEDKTSESEASSSAATSGPKKKQNWRQKMKKDPSKYKKKKESDRLYSLNYRLNQTEEERKKGSEATKYRMRQLRKRKKAHKLAAAAQQPAPKPKQKTDARRLTRAEQKKENATREKERLKKRAQRAKYTAERREAINARRRELRHQERLELLEFRKLKHEEMQKRKRIQKEKERLQLEKLQFDKEVSTSQTTTYGGAQRKSVSRAFKGLPKSPNRFAKTVSDVIKKASPSKRKAMARNGLGSPHDEVRSLVARSIFQQVKDLKRRRNKKDLTKKRALLQACKLVKKYKCKSKACNLLGVSRNTFRKSTSTESGNPYSKSKRSLSEHTKQLVEKFYEEAAIELPDKKFISKKTLKKTGFLQEPVATVYRNFKKKHPNVTIGSSSFYAIRPKHIKLASAIKYRGCLCEYCTNVDLKIDAINHVAHANNMKSKFHGVYHLSKMTMCDKTGSQKYNKRACILRECSKCGTSIIQKHMSDLEEKQGDKLIKWKQWEKVEGKKKDGKIIHKQQIVTKQGRLKECIDELVTEVKPISAHLFNAAWQNQQFRQVAKHPPPQSVVMVLDFAENYTCQFQDEIQAAHWHHASATVHPIVCYYPCKICEDVMQESLVFISPDKRHDYHAVHEFMGKAINHLQQKMEIRQIIRFSDGCGAQYKSKGPFLDVAMSEAEYGIKTHHNFFGSRHGKGPSDGESAVVKRQATDAVCAGTAVIQNAFDMFNFCSDKITKMPEEGKCLHFQRSVFLVEEVTRERGHEDVGLRTVKGTRGIHSITGFSDGKVRYRNLSCFCASCVQDGELRNCSNKKYVMSWKETTLFTKPPQLQRQPGMTFNYHSLLKKEIKFCS